MSIQVRKNLYSSPFPNTNAIASLVERILFALSFALAAPNGVTTLSWWGSLRVSMTPGAMSAVVLYSW